MFLCYLTPPSTVTVPVGLAEWTLGRGPWMWRPLCKLVLEHLAGGSSKPPSPYTRASTTAPLHPHAAPRVTKLSLGNWKKEGETIQREQRRKSFR